MKKIGLILAIVIALLPLVIWSLHQIPSPIPREAVTPGAATISMVGITLIKQFEGFSPYPYDDVGGKPTIGFGHLIVEGEDIEIPLLGQAAEDLLRKDLRSAERGVNDLTLITLRQNQFDALTSFTFNLGVSNYKTSTLRKRVNAERHDDVPSELMRWVHVDGQVIKGLVRRRQAESSLYSQ